MVDETAVVMAHEQLAQGLWRLDVQLDTIPKIVQPGQFVQLQLGEGSEHILRRPLSVYSVYEDAHNNFAYAAFLYQVVGKGTEFLTRVKKGDNLRVLGPLGRGWRPPKDTQRALLVGGGAGWAPLALLSGCLRASGVEVHALIGARNAEVLCALNSGSEHRCYTLRKVEAPQGTHYFEHLASDDGSLGFHGFTTDAMPELLANYTFDYVATCGPEPMQRIVATQATGANIDCEVSLERRMACGIGACLSCVVNTTAGKQRACVDGPVFDAREVIW